MSTLSPLFSATVGPFNIADGLQEVLCDIQGVPLRFVQVTPSVAPAAGQKHKVAINRKSTLISLGNADTRGFDMNGIDPAIAARFLAYRVYVQAGADGTSFTIEGNV